MIEDILALTIVHGMFVTAGLLLGTAAKRLLRRLRGDMEEKGEGNG